MGIRVFAAGEMKKLVWEGKCLPIRKVRGKDVKPPFYVPLPDRVSGTGGRMFRA